MISRFLRQRLSRSPNVEKNISPLQDALNHLEQVIKKERAFNKTKRKRVAGDPHEPNDWSFLKPLKLPSKPKPVLCESPPSINHKPPPRGIHSANPPIMPHGGWAKVKKKSPLRKKKRLTIVLPKKALKRGKRKQEAHNKSKKRKLNNTIEVDTPKGPYVKKKTKSSGRKKHYRGTYQWRRKDNKFVIMKWRQIIAEKDTEKEIAQEWDKFIFEAQNHGRTIKAEAFNFPDELPTRRKRSKTRVYFEEYRKILKNCTASQIEELQEPLNPPKNKSIF